MYKDNNLIATNVHNVHHIHLQKLQCQSVFLDSDLYSQSHVFFMKALSTPITVYHCFLRVVWHVANAVDFHFVSAFHMVPNRDFPRLFKRKTFIFLFSKHCRKCFCITYVSYRQSRGSFPKASSVAFLIANTPQSQPLGWV